MLAAMWLGAIRLLQFLAEVWQCAARSCGSHGEMPHLVDYDRGSQDVCDCVVLDLTMYPSKWIRQSTLGSDCVVFRLADGVPTHMATAAHGQCRRSGVV